MGLSLSIFTQFTPKGAEFGRITQNNGQSAVQDNSRSLILIPIEKTYATYNLINTNLHPISHRFQVIGDYWSNLHFRLGVPVFNIFTLGQPLNSGPQNLASINRKHSSIV